MAKRKASKPRTTRAAGRKLPRRPSRGHFVGRDPSPVLDHYPPKDPSAVPKAPPPITLSSSPPSPTPSASPSPSPGSPSQPLITLERPFDIDEFSTLLGETTIRVTVPRDALPEVLRRVTEFMGFGIYVYAVAVKPVPSELLKSFVVELQRVDYSAEKQVWLPFEEKGTTDSPFGPSGGRS